VYQAIVGSGYSTRFNWLGYLPGLSEILSHSELIPDAALTPNSYEKEIQFQ